MPYHGRSDQSTDQTTDGAQGPRGQGGGQGPRTSGCTGCFTRAILRRTRRLSTFRATGNTIVNIQAAPQFKQGTFHAKEFNSLVCGCCSEDLPNCTEGGTNQNPRRWRMLQARGDLRSPEWKGMR